MRKGKKSIATAVSHLPAASCLTASAENSENPLKISVESSRESHLVRVNEPFEFIITANKPQKLKVIISMDGEAVLQCF